MTIMYIFIYVVLTCIFSGVISNFNLEHPYSKISTIVLLVALLILHNFFSF